MKAGILLALFALTLTLAAGEIVRCKVESCGGWRLNRLPEVKAFLNKDLEQKYENTQFKKVPGKSPEMFFYDESDNLVEKLDIAEMKRDQLNQLMLDKGFKLKEGTNAHDEV